MTDQERPVNPDEGPGKELEEFLAEVPASKGQDSENLLRSEEEFEQALRVARLVQQSESSEEDPVENSEEDSADSSDAEAQVDLSSEEAVAEKSDFAESVTTETLEAESSQDEAPDTASVPAAAEPETRSRIVLPPGALRAGVPKESIDLLDKLHKQFEKLDEIAGENEDKVEISIAKEEILHGDTGETEEAAADASAASADAPASDAEMPVWKRLAEERYAAQEKHREQLIQERREYEAKRRAGRNAYEADLKAKREAYENQRRLSNQTEEERLLAERLAADAKLKAEREAKRAEREAYEASQRGDVPPSSSPASPEDRLRKPDDKD